MTRLCAHCDTDQQVVGGDGLKHVLHHAHCPTETGVWPTVNPTLCTRCSEDVGAAYVLTEHDGEHFVTCFDCGAWLAATKIGWNK